MPLNMTPAQNFPGATWLVPELFAGNVNGNAVALNNGPHCLHGGVKGSRLRVFDAVQNNASSIDMRYV